MKRLGNPRHQAFVENMAKGMMQKDAYQKVYGSGNASAASKLAKKYASQIEEMQAVQARKIAAMDEGATLARMGIDKMWIANAYRRIYDESRRLGNNSVAVSVLKNIEKLRAAEEVEAEVQAGTAPAPQRIDIGALGAVLDKFSNVLALSNEPQQDVTPTSDEVPALSYMTWSHQKAHRATEAE